MYKRVSRNSRGVVGDYFTGQIMEIPGSGEGGGGGGRGRAYAKFPAWCGMVWIFSELHN